MAARTSHRSSINPTYYRGEAKPRPPYAVPRTRKQPATRQLRQPRSATRTDCAAFLDLGTGSAFVVIIIRYSTEHGHSLSSSLSSSSSSSPSLHPCSINTNLNRIGPALLPPPTSSGRAVVLSETESPSPPVWGSLYSILIFPLQPTTITPRESLLAGPAGNIAAPFGVAPPSTIQRQQRRQVQRRAGSPSPQVTQVIQGGAVLTTRYSSALLDSPPVSGLCNLHCTLHPAPPPTGTGSPHRNRSSGGTCTAALVNQAKRRSSPPSNPAQLPQVPTTTTANHQPFLPVSPWKAGQTNISLVNNRYLCPPSSPRPNVAVKERLQDSAERWI
ncbi:uncharacterized protein BP5553_01462 [Venustampulla echinocandica]|uniref:Uncharacterized protein n=1 Tax=Venustampulla echinocandica TaxID=2656787 RepID=A0A370U157_9HELO|nr:uncharacterized protein BP5553_01462 [Venustampulla echinocandica]RDL41483.1 hypothetical protein BP5553_01462 [Venustampulla echinocandica]